MNTTLVILSSSFWSVVCILVVIMIGYYFYKPQKSDIPGTQNTTDTQDLVPDVQDIEPVNVVLKKEEPKPDPLSGKFYIKMIGKNNLCVDTGGYNGGDPNGSNAFHPFTCDPNNGNQQFTFDKNTYLFTNVKSNKCIDDGTGEYNKTKLTGSPLDFFGVPINHLYNKLTLWTCDKNQGNQMFRYDPKTKLLKSLVKENKCVDDGGGTTSAASKFSLQDCNPSSINQQVEIIPI
jgi:hypothetical protein